jgi:Cd2+/Zn2+-exporting ATPase
MGTYAKAIPEGEWQAKTIVIGGLDCADCAKKLEEMIRKSDGVAEAVLSFTSGKLHLRYRGPLSGVYNIIENLGYEIRESNDDDATWANARKRVLYAVLSAVALLLAMIFSRLNPLYGNIFLFAAVAIGGHITFRRGIIGIAARQLDMNVLMTVAVAGALFIGEWWEAATVAFLFATSNALESYTAEKNRRSIRALMTTIPETAHRLTGEETETVAVGEIAAGEEILIRPGERIPLDGIVMSGSSSVMEAAITGESMPVGKGKGHGVFAGTLNGNGSLRIRVKGTAADSTLAKIVTLVEEAQLRRAPAQRFIDQFASVYTPVVIGIAAVLAIGGPLVLGGGWHPWLYRGLALLIVACPCALVISTPVSIVAALTNAARNGVLIKGGAYLEIAGGIRAMVFDKTGTLTKGTPAVEAIQTFKDADENNVIQIAASLEAHSEHLLAAAVREYAKERKLVPLPVENFTVYPGQGIEGTVAGIHYSLGSPEFLIERGLSPEETAGVAAGTATAIGLAADGKIFGVILISDTLREESATVLETLRSMGIVRLAMLTGDRAEVAALIASRLNLDDIASGLLPAEKEAAVRRFKEQYGNVAMVGDGINDAPALASADLGIAMGVAGSPTALETADVALMGDDLEKLPLLIGLSRQTMVIIKQNIALALLIKGIAILLVFPGWLTLWLAILADMGASLLVTANGMRLLAYGPKQRKK